MAMSGSSALARVAVNLGCEIQVAMARSRDPEPEFFRKATGNQYDREFGERLPARRRGSKFEQELFRNNAIKLCEALCQLNGGDPPLRIDVGQRHENTIEPRSLDAGNGGAMLGAAAEDVAA